MSLIRVLISVKCDMFSFLVDGWAFEPFSNAIDLNDVLVRFMNVQKKPRWTMMWT